MNRNIFRVIDANLNRSREGLRVCEDIARFILDAPSITGALKKIRHEISDILKKIPGDKLFGSRDSVADVGARSGLYTEMTRRDAKDIFGANIQRAKESLRVLEEFFKLIDKNTAAEFSVLRFKVYEIEKKSAKKIASLRNIR